MDFGVSRVFGHGRTCTEGTVYCGIGMVYFIRSTGSEKEIDSHLRGSKITMVGALTHSPFVTLEMEVDN